MFRDSLDALEERLAPYGFLRANRGWDGADGGTLVLRSGERVPVSRRAGPAVRAALGLP